MGGLYGVFNLWHYARSIRLTGQAEFDQGSFTSPSGRTRTARAFFTEIDYLLGNGLNLLAEYDWEDPDREVKGDAAQRLAIGVQITPYPGITLDTRFRALFPAEGASGGDIFLQLHLWY
jgi:hypothetical protein